LIGAAGRDAHPFLRDECAPGNLDFFRAVFLPLSPEAEAATKR
jgi:hypothetical protein